MVFRRACQSNRERHFVGSDPAHRVRFFSGDVPSALWTARIETIRRSPQSLGETRFARVRIEAQAARLAQEMKVD
jgi:hypothetical protein